MAEVPSVVPVHLGVHAGGERHHLEGRDERDLLLPGPGEADPEVVPPCGVHELVEYRLRRGSVDGNPLVGVDDEVEGGRPAEAIVVPIVEAGADEVLHFLRCVDCVAVLAEGGEEPERTHRFRHEDAAFLNRLVLAGGDEAGVGLPPESVAVGVTGPRSAVDQQPVFGS